VGPGGGLGSRPAAELREHVADVHVDRPRAEEQLVGDLAVRPPHGGQAQDLELAPRQPEPLEVGGDTATETLVDRLARYSSFGSMANGRSGAAGSACVVLP
jgi:hypothetical protein